VLWQVSGIGIIAIGMTLVILTAGIDLSVGSVLSLCSVVCAMLLMDREWTKASVIAVACFALTAGLLARWATVSLISGRNGAGAGKGLRAIGWLVGIAVCAVAAVWGLSRTRGFGVIACCGVLRGLLSCVTSIIAQGQNPALIVPGDDGRCRWLSQVCGRLRGAVHQSTAIPHEAVAHPFPSTAANIRFSVTFIPVPGFFVTSGSWLLLLNKRRIGVSLRVGVTKSRRDCPASIRTGSKSSFTRSRHVSARRPCCIAPNTPGLRRRGSNPRTRRDRRVVIGGTA
jgi:ribose/xylose/arabinose/galactoside ABC-type transport system permease subunit